MSNHVDLIILGGGPGGYNLAEQAGHAKLKTVLIEGKTMGGVCLNEGCVPTKTLLYSAKIYDYSNHSKAYGVSFKDAKLDHKEVIKRKNKIVKSLTSGVENRVKSTGVTIVKGMGAIQGKTTDGYEVAVNDEIYVAPKLVIATGSRAATPPITGLQDALTAEFALTNREILDMEKLPKEMVVIGGGVIGLEMCNYFAIAGVKITVIEALDHIAGQNDPDIIKLLQKNFEKMGVKFYLSSMVNEINSAQKEVVFTNQDGKQEKIKTDKVLLSIGRRPNIENIGLESIGVQTERNAIVVDEHMQTNIPNVYAIGDVNGTSMLAHTAYREGEVALHAIQNKRDVMRYNAIPAVVYTNPEIGAVGYTEEIAREKGIDTKVISIPMAFSGRYMVENDGGNGICKLIFNAKHDTLVGAHVYANYASEFIVAAGILIELQLTVDDMKEIVFPHPTVCEIIREALLQY